MRPVRRSSAVLYIGALALAIYACETSRRIGGVQPDTQAPTITLANTAGDTQDIAGGLRFNVQANDNLGLKTVDLTFSGGLIGQLDTTFTTTVKAYNVGHTLTFGSGSGAGGLIQIIGRAVDGNGNFDSDTIYIYLSNVQALRVQLVLPSPGALASTGKGIPVDIIAVQAGGITKIGYLVSPANAVVNPTAPPTDSIVYNTAPYADSVEYVDTLIVVPSSGTFNIIGFAEDSAGRRGFSSVVTVTIQSVATDVTPPIVAHRIASRVEVDDTIHVRAQDPSAISWIGFEVDTNGVRMKFDTVNVSAGNLSDVTRHFSLGLQGLQPLPRYIAVKGYACDLAIARNCSFTNNTTLVPSAPLQSAASRGNKNLFVPGAPGYRVPMAPAGLIDTVIVVNGITVPLAGAASVVDAIYNDNRHQLYLSNPAFNRVEVYDVTSSSFLPPIGTAGGQPAGLAMWPRDTLGGYKDTIIVADAGGTYLGVINVGTGGPRQILWRQDLPNFQIQTYKVLTQAGGAVVHITPYDLSDLPQYVATVCRPVSGGTACHPDSVYALYSTSPTASSTPPFSSRATLRLEKLINTTDPNQLFSHLFWEIAATTFTTGNDTLRIVLDRGRNLGAQVLLSACAGVTVSIQGMGLGDRTFARNSGNFTHAFFGEGGNVTASFARVMSYDARRSLQAGPGTFTTCSTGNGTSDAGRNDVDLGMSPGFSVSDFISNTGVQVLGVATNFNGLTNAVRADSIYYLDQDLRRKATSAALVGLSNQTPGMDMNYRHDFAPTGPCPPTSTSCGGGTDKNERLIFVASPNSGIDVYDTYFGALLTSISVRDPITGPLRAARDNVTGEQLLFAITPNGLVTLRLPSTLLTNPLPSPRPAGSP